MKIFLFILLSNFFVLQSKPLILTSNNVVKYILQEITIAKAEIDVIEMNANEKKGFKSSDIYKLNASKAFVALTDSSAIEIGNLSSGDSFGLLELLPDSMKMRVDYGSVYDMYVDSLTYKITDTLKLDSLNNYYYSDSTLNEYFHLDPLTVKALLPELQKKLSEIMPEYKEFFNKNADRFTKRLDLLHKQISSELEQLKGMPVYSESPFLQYYINRYNLQNAASLITNQSFGKSYVDFIQRDMHKIGINILFVTSDTEYDSLENVSVKKIDLLAAENKYEGYADFILSVTNDIKNSLLFY